MKQILLKIYFQFFAYLAKFYLFRHKSLVIWVTGSIGKTSCRMIVSEILSKNLWDKIVYTSNKNFNWELWLSLSILWISKYIPNALWVINIIFESIFISLFWNKKYDIIFLEYWIDHIWEMDFLLSIVKPDFWIVTKIDKVHSKQFKTTDNIAKEKYKLLQNSKKYSYLNIDCDYSLQYSEKILNNKLYYTTNIDKIDKKLDVYWIDYNLLLEWFFPKTTFKLISQEKEIFDVKSNIIWTENIWYISIWYDILDKIYKYYYSSGFFEESINKKIDLELTLQESRFSIFSWLNESILIDSTYNSSPWSMSVVLDNYELLSNTLYKDYKKVLVIWEMRELWNYSEQEHKNLAIRVNTLSKDIFVVWEEMKNYFIPEIERLWNEWVKFYKNSKLLWEDLKQFLYNNKKCIVLFKWSQNTIFLEEAVKIVQLNIEDNNKVCRQQNFWLDKKSNFFDK